MLKKRKKELNTKQCLLDINRVLAELPGRMSFDVLPVNNADEECLPFHFYDYLALSLSF